MEVGSESASPLVCGQVTLQPAFVGILYCNTSVVVCYGVSNYSYGSIVCFSTHLDHEVQYVSLNHILKTVHNYTFLLSFFHPVCILTVELCKLIVKTY